MKKLVNIILIISLQVCILLALAAYIKSLPKRKLVALRTLFFASYTSDFSLLTLEPNQLTKRLGFLIDNPGLEKKWLEKHPLLLMANDTTDEIQRIKLLVLDFSKNGGADCGDLGGLGEAIRAVKSGRGCCSDHTKVFIAFCKANGIFGREVHFKKHTVNEFWSRKHRKWIWIDPQFALMAKDVSGNYLSFLELRNHQVLNSNFTFEFFGTESHELNSLPISENRYYKNPDLFNEIGITLGNNVVEEDLLRNRFYNYPKAVWQLYGLVTRQFPAQLFFVDEPVFKRMQQALLYLGISFILILNIYVSNQILRRIF